MTVRRRSLANFLGTHVLPYMNRRMVCPPGRPAVHGRPNIVVATPKRSGTHVLIDTILNNMPAFRNRPLYIDLDQAWKRRDSSDRLFDHIDPQAGYVIKTHLPIDSPGAAMSPHVLELLDAATVLTVHRPVEAIIRSMERWKQSGNDEMAGRILAETAAFWKFWEKRPRMALEFGDLFDDARMRDVIDELAACTGTERAARHVTPLRPEQLRHIYVNKAMTRLLGRHAPRIDTTIHTLK